jgi:hypothetical protein
MNMAWQKIWQKSWRRHRWQRELMAFGALAICVVASLARAASFEQTMFETPQAAVIALVGAVKANDRNMLRVILGPHSRRLINSGDDVADEQRRDAFVKTYSEANKIVLDGDARATLLIGEDEWPLPIPVVKAGGRWYFDASQGEKEILARLIGANELAAIQVCLAIVEAENDYAAQAATGDGVPHYAGRFVSTPGKHDGLYWETQTDEAPSPLGPLLAAAAHEGYTKSKASPLAPYHGYYYKLLGSQGANAPGGAYDYLIKGRMIGGFAVLAYPARYGASGIMSFLVNHDGAVYEKNLGRRTKELAGRMTSFDPDSSWGRQ